MINFDILKGDVYVVEVTNIKREYEDGYHDRVLYLCERGTEEQLSVLSIEAWLFDSIEEATRHCTSDGLIEAFKDAKFRVIKLNPEVVYG